MFEKADPQERAAFMNRYDKLYTQRSRKEIRLVYVDEAPCHRDMELGYTWAAKNQLTWLVSDSEPLSARINWYSAYDFGAGLCFIWNEDNWSQEHTKYFLHRMVDWLAD